MSGRKNNGARPAGLEPTTCGLEGRCSIQLSYGRTGCAAEDSRLVVRARLYRRNPSQSSPDGFRATHVQSVQERAPSFVFNDASSLG